jgi:hypothetical protein
MSSLGRGTFLGGLAIVGFLVLLFVGIWILRKLISVHVVYLPSHSRFHRPKKAGMSAAAHVRRSRGSVAQAKTVPGNLQFCDSNHPHPRKSVRRWHRTKGGGHEGVFGADAGPGARGWRCDYSSSRGSLAHCCGGRRLLWRKLVRAAGTRRGSRPPSRNGA